MSKDQAKKRPLAKFAQEAVDVQQQALAQWETEVFILAGEDRAHLQQRVQKLLAFLERFPNVKLKDLAFSLNTSLPAPSTPPSSLSQKGARRDEEPATPPFLSLTGGGTGGCRLAVVAGTVVELANRLTLAAKRIADAQCQQIKDATGVYFFAQPLHAPGSVALLFPGEGAQYLNMLGDLLPHFPEVQAGFDSGDKLMAPPGSDDKPLSRILFLPPQASAEQRKEAEEKLRHLDIAMNSVLVADGAVFRLLQQLGLHADAMAGHSAGELAALGAAGCIELDMSLLGQVTTTMNVMQHLEEEGDGPAAVLLAVGAGRETVAEVIQQKVGNNAFVAMDNCPHQTVVVGLKEPMALVEAELQARRFLCERLSLRRPYHTFLFEPCLDPLHNLFAATNFRPPQTPIYSCTTAQLFPPDPVEIRRLTVAHWACPVEFTRMIEQMYADGLRLFVEAGPRGNLSAFVEDILRNRSFAAIPVNTQRRSGITQLNYLAALLSAHHVPLQLGHLYRRRRPVRLEWERQAGSSRQQAAGSRQQTTGSGQEAADGRKQATDSQQPAADSQPLAETNNRLLPMAHGPLPIAQSPVPRPSAKSPVVQNYWNVMEQFLDVQNEVMAQFLSRPRAKRRVQGSGVRGQRELPIAGGGSGINKSASLPNLESVVGESASATRHSPLATRHFPLLGEIVRQEPGRELVMRRRLDLSEDLFADQHTVGGRSTSNVDPDYHGLPVLPMTFSLEIMAEVASWLLPGKTAMGLKKIKLFRWLAYDDEEPTTIEVSARLLPERPSEPGATHQVQLEIKDLGNSRDEKPRGVTSQGIVFLGDGFPAAPTAGDFPLQDEYPCRITTSVLYHNLFHGPIFQGVYSLGRIGDDGIESFCKVPDRSEWFRSTSEPTLLIDPVLADVVMHPIAAWHLEQPDQAGRILLPFELGKIELYGPPPPVSSKVTSRVRLDEATGRNFTHSIDAIGPDGKLWCRMTRLKYWRFFIPFGDVNFHGPKDEYFISKEWPQVLPGPVVASGEWRVASGERFSLHSSLPQVESGEWRGESGEGDLPSRYSPRATRHYVSAVRLDMPADQRQANMRLVTAKVTLTPREFQEYRHLKGPDRKINDWLFGRIAAKDAVRVLWQARYGERLFPSDIELVKDAKGRLRARHRGSIPAEMLPAASFGHVDDIAVGLAGFYQGVGIEIVRVKPREAGFEELAFNADERELLNIFGAARDEWIARLFSAKEAVAKALGHGLIEGPMALTVRDLQPQIGQVFVTLGPLLAASFPEFAGTTLIAYTVRQEDLVVATTFCERGSS